jgi:hypothetical protein
MSAKNDFKHMQTMLQLPVPFFCFFSAAVKLSPTSHMPTPHFPVSQISVPLCIEAKKQRFLASRLFLSIGDTRSDLSTAEAASALDVTFLFQGCELKIFL